MQRAPNLSSKNPTPNWLANKGIYSIIASRTLQCLSSASSTMAGNKDWDNRSIPITCKNSLINKTLKYLLCWVYICVACIFKDINKQVLRVKLIRGKEKVFKSLKEFWKLKQLQKTRTTWFTWSSLLMMFRRTSGNSSFRRDRKIGRSCSIVASCIEDKVVLRITIAVKCYYYHDQKKDAFEDNTLLKIKNPWKTSGTKLVTELNYQNPVNSI